MFVRLQLAVRDFSGRQPDLSGQQLQTNRAQTHAAAQTTGHEESQCKYTVDTTQFITQLGNSSSTKGSSLAKTNPLIHN